MAQTIGPTGIQKKLCDGGGAIGSGASLFDNISGGQNHHDARFGVDGQPVSAIRTQQWGG